MKYETGTFAHICARGTRRLPIEHDDQDRWHFLELLYYVNHTESRRNLFRQLKELKEEQNTKAAFFWPPMWEPRTPIVNIVAYALVENHFHLLLEQRQENGIPRFMQKIGIGMAKYYNQKYKTSGNLFQGKYRAKIVDTDEYLMYVSVYIHVKNILEVYPGGMKAALRDVDKALRWAIEYPFGSLGDYAGSRNSCILEKSVLGRMFEEYNSYRKFAKECLIGMNLEEKLGKLAVE